METASGIAGLDEIYWLPLVVLIVQGVILRMFTLFFLVGTCRDQQIKPPVSKAIKEWLCGDSGKEAETVPVPASATPGTSSSAKLIHSKSH